MNYYRGSHEEEEQQQDTPPDYLHVLLDKLNSQKCLPLILREAITNFLNDGDSLPVHPYRTYIRLTERKFSPERRFGVYHGELDPKLRRNGYGVIRYDNGDIYRGEWKKGKAHGRGSYLWANSGSVYSGEWRKGLKDGNGLFIYGSRRAEAGTIYEGIWRKDKICGEGTLSVPQSKEHHSSILLKGKWKEDPTSDTLRIDTRIC